MNRAFADFQVRCAETAVYPQDSALAYLTLGLSGEAGELANKVKKVLRDDGGVVSAERASEILSEAGDCLWYIAELCSHFNVQMGDVAADTIRKLKDRQQRGVLRGSGDER